MASVVCPFPPPHSDNCLVCRYEAVGFVRCSRLLGRNRRRWSEDHNGLCSGGPTRFGIGSAGLISLREVEPLAFEDPQLAGLCEDSIADFAEGEPAPSSTEQEAVAQFVAEHKILAGLALVGGTIFLREQRVGTYQVVDRPGGTLAVESGE